MSTPRPSVRPGLLYIPAAASSLEIRFAPLSDRDKFDQGAWRREPFASLNGYPGWWVLDIDNLMLADGEYEYEFLLNGNAAEPVADPWAEEITRFGGYRSVFRISGQTRVSQPFRWNDEIPPGGNLPQNNQIVVYEMPLRWMSAAPETERQVDLGTFDKVIFERLNALRELGINCIELLPVQDSPDTLNWGYGTRFFFAPDIDMGTPVDAKFFIKRCHQLGIRVILDVVMNHSAGECPLTALDREAYYISAAHPEPGRATGWSNSVFRFLDPDNGTFAGREFFFEMAEYWIREYHIDGFRIDEFAGINHWEFLQQFRDRAWAEHNNLFPTRPFYVVGEDSNRRFRATYDAGGNPGDRKVVDGIWNFSYRDDLRRLITNQLYTNYGQMSRTERVKALLRGWPMWDSYGGGSVREGYGDLAQSVNYFTSHDVKEQPRLMNYIFGALLSIRGLGEDSVDSVRGVLANLPDKGPVKEAHWEALDRVRSAFAVLLTSVGIPMFLAGEEFADVHDLQYGDDRLKMSDPVDWYRRYTPGHGTLLAAVAELIKLRTSTESLQRNEIEFLYFHPDMDHDEGARVFAYCRTAGRPLGSNGQVIVVVNAGAQSYPVFDLPSWPWGVTTEIAAPVDANPAQYSVLPRMSLSLGPFQARVFRS